MKVPYKSRERKPTCPKPGNTEIHKGEMKMKLPLGVKENNTRI